MPPLPPPLDFTTNVDSISPVIFVVENNFFSSHMHISARQPSDCTARFAIANQVPHQIVDGNDVVAVADD